MQPIARPPTKSSMNCEPLIACSVRLGPPDCGHAAHRAKDRQDQERRLVAESDAIGATMHRVLESYSPRASCGPASAGPWDDLLLCLLGQAQVRALCHQWPRSAGLSCGPHVSKPSAAGRCVAAPL